MTRKLKNLFTILLLIFITSCASKKSTPELKKHFSDKQIADLNLLTDFFKQEVCDGQNSDFATCFEKILPKLVEYGWNPILERIEYKKQKEVYKQISQETFNEIWAFCETTNFELDRKYKSLCAKTNGQYVKFLKDVGLNNKLVADYHERLLAAGDFESMGLLQQRIYMKRSEIDLTDRNIQILIAIHFLTQNDQQKRHLETKEE